MYLIWYLWWVDCTVVVNSNPCGAPLLKMHSPCQHLISHPITAAFSSSPPPIWKYHPSCDISGKHLGSDDFRDLSNQFRTQVLGKELWPVITVCVFISIISSCDPYLVSYLIAGSGDGCMYSKESSTLHFHCTLNLHLQLYMYILNEVQENIGIIWLNGWWLWIDWRLNRIFDEVSGITECHDNDRMEDVKTLSNWGRCLLSCSYKPSGN